MPFIALYLQSPLTFKFFLLEGQLAIVTRLFVYKFVYIYHSSLKFCNNLYENPTNTLWTAVAPKQEGPFDSEKLQLYKFPNKMAVWALALRCNRSLKFFVHP